MASVKCMFCGNRVYHHGYPEKSVPVENIFCTLNDWRKLEEENMAVDHLELEYDGIFFYVWRCWRCGTFIFFNDRWDNIGVYTPKEENSSAPMQVPFEFGPFWYEFLWYDINETDTPASEVMTKFPGNHWLAKNNDELRIYEDEARTKCIAQFRRIQIVNPVTVATMSLDAFKKMLANWDDVEFFYHKIYYNFMREDDGVNIYRGHGYQRIVYHAATTDVNDIVNAKILDDGRSIAEAQAEIEL